MKSLHELMNLEGRVALITGGAGYIGRACGEVLAELGANLVVLDLDEARCQETAVSLQKQYGVQTYPLAVDLSQEDDVLTVCERVLTRFNRLDILIHCAALVGTSQLKGWATPFTAQSSATWRRALEINLTAPFILTQSCAEALKNSDHGSVIFFSSIYGLVGPHMDLYAGTSLGSPAAYGASKGGLLQFTRWLSTVLAPHVRANAISPGGVWRQQPETFQERYIAHTPLARMATEEDLKGAVAYLASDLSAYVTGQNIVVDGGWTAW